MVSTVFHSEKSTSRERFTASKSTLHINLTDYVCINIPIGNFLSRIYRYKLKFPLRTLSNIVAITHQQMSYQVRLPGIDC